MPRFLIERTYTVDMDTLPEVATRSKAIGHHRFPEIVWEHSHVVIDENGTPKSYCVYAAPSEEMVRAHADVLGDHFVQGSTRSRATCRRPTSRSSTTRASSTRPSGVRRRAGQGGGTPAR